MSAACSQSRRKNVSFYLNFESVLEDKYWLCSFISVEVNEETRCNKKWLDWINENSCFI